MSELFTSLGQDIGWAMKRTKDGHGVRRRIWPEGLHLVYMDNGPGSPVHGLDRMLLISSGPETYAAWAPTHADILAWDWEVKQ